MNTSGSGTERRPTMNGLCCVTRAREPSVTDEGVENPAHTAGVPGGLRLLGDDDPFEQLDPIVGPQQALVDEGEVPLGGETSRDAAGEHLVALDSP